MIFNLIYNTIALAVGIALYLLMQFLTDRSYDKESKN